MAFSEILATIHSKIASKLGLPAPTTDEDKAFDNWVGIWPAFADTVDVFRRLSMHYQPVVLSNVDRVSFSRTQRRPSRWRQFDPVLTAQDIGSYKPDLRKFEYMLDCVESSFYDHYPAEKTGLRSVHIARKGAVMGNVEESRQVYNGKFDTRGEINVA